MLLMVRADNLVAAFASKHPAAQFHVLIVPIEHIRTTAGLTRRHVHVLDRMRAVRATARPATRASLRHFTRPDICALCGPQVAEDLAATAGVTQPRLVFHRPAHSSVEHLHMHCLGPPFRNMWKQHVVFRCAGPVLGAHSNWPPSSCYSGTLMFWPCPCCPAVAQEGFALVCEHCQH